MEFISPYIHLYILNISRLRYILQCSLFSEFQEDQPRAMGDEVPTVHEDERKLFVGALPQEAKDSDIKEYFEAYGEIDSINLKVLFRPCSFTILKSYYEDGPRHWQIKRIRLYCFQDCGGYRGGAAANGSRGDGEDRLRPGQAGSER